MDPLPAVPTMTMAERLEAVRKRLGFDDLKEFHAALGFDREKDRGYGSYAAARIYHAGQDATGSLREAPVAYLARIVERFPEIDFGWLARGFGFMTREEVVTAFRLHEEDWSKLKDVLREVFGETSEYDSTGTDLGFRVQRAVDELTLNWVLAQGGYDDPKIRSQDWRQVAEALATPLHTLGTSPSAFPTSALAHYVIVLSEALRFLFATRESRGQRDEA